VASKAIEKGLDPERFEVFVEAGYLLCPDPLTIRQPDVSVLSKLRIASAGDDSYFEGAPDLAVEIVSPSDAADTIKTKVLQYLQYGALQVWVLYPKTKVIHVFHASSSATILISSQTLENSPVLPGWSIQVAQLFAV
jgi:Uma2 family endonuclease